MACGIVSELLAMKARCGSPAEAFTAGILHDLGRIILDQYLRNDFLRALELMKEEGLSSCLAEERVLGINHAIIGGALAKQWGVPVPLAEAITYHHDPLAVESIGEIALLVYLGDVSCMQQGLYSGIEEPAPETLEIVLRRLGLTQDILSRALSPFEAIETRAKAFVSSARI